MSVRGLNRLVIDEYRVQLTDSADSVADSVVDSEASVVLVGAVTAAASALLVEDEATLEVAEELALEDDAAAASVSSSATGSPVQPCPGTEMS
jgi:hypothetical protein